MSSELVTAIEQVKQWMLEHEAAVLVENLAPGATAEELEALEDDFGFPLHAELKALWSLHHGQTEEFNGFVEAMDLFGGDSALLDLDTLQIALAALRKAPVLPQTGLSPDELA